MENINIAIDGPAGAGKSTISKLVASRLGYLYIDTGAMYRALTLKAMEANIDLTNDEILNHYLKNHPISLASEGGTSFVKVDGMDVTEEIRDPEVTRNVSLVSSHLLVRETMVELQRNLAKDSNVVMDGRDIGTNVLPQAEVKIFLTASLEERAKRRKKDFEAKGHLIELKQIAKEIETRDKQDETREIAPLRQADDAVLIDTSSLTIDKVVEKILDLVREKIGERD